MHQFPWMSPYVAFDNNPIYFTDPYGLASINGDDGCDEGDPPAAKGTKTTNPNTGTEYEADGNGGWTQLVSDMKVSAKGKSESQVNQNRTDAILEKGKFASSKYDPWRGSQDAFFHSQSMIGKNGYTTEDHLRNYKNNKWLYVDPASASFDKRKTREIWGTTESWQTVADVAHFVASEAPMFLLPLGEGINVFKYLRKLIKTRHAGKVVKAAVEIATEDDILMFASKVGAETVEGIANFVVKDEKLYLNALHVSGSTAGKVGRQDLWKVAKEIGEQFNVKEVIIQGGRRTTGKYKGSMPSPVTIKVK